MEAGTGRQTGFEQEMEALWGPFGADSECGVLRQVLMHIPGEELSLVNERNFEDWLFIEPVDPDRLRAQVEHLVAVYRSHGVDVQFVEGQRTDRPNAMFLRDLMLTTHQGVILARPGHVARRGEERAVAATLSRLGMPIVRSVAGDGTYDGACAMLVDRDLALVATSTRTNQAGADQVAEALSAMGVRTVIRCTTPWNQIHLDGCMNVVDRRTVVINPWQMPYDAVVALKAADVRIIEATALDELPGAGINFVAVRPGFVIIPEGFRASEQLLSAHGIGFEAVAMDEVVKAGGEMHCLTGVLRRDPL
jgi:arginine deiminase